MKGMQSGFVFAAAIVGAVGLFGCAPIPTMTMSPVETPPLGNWTTVPCSIVQQQHRDACIAAHANAHLGPEEHVTAEGGPIVSSEQRGDAAIPATVYTPEEIEAGRTAVDRMLAIQLKDPMSAMQYRVSSIFACRGALPIRSADKALEGCVCYEVNAKNSYGGYTGASIALAELVPTASEYVALSVPRELLTVDALRACSASDFSPRSADKIRAAVQ